MPLTCVCVKDYTINHALTCATGGFIIKRHNDVRGYLAHLLNEVCADVSIEPHLVQVTEGETASTNREDAARLDIAARDFWRPSQRAYFDIRVFNANAQSNISRNIEETFIHHEREKSRQYSDRIVNVEHGSFTPIIFGTHGDYSQLTSRFIYHFAKLISQKRNICFSESKSWLNIKLSNLVVRLTILCIKGSKKNQTAQHGGYIYSGLKCPNMLTKYIQTQAMDGESSYIFFLPFYFLLLILYTQLFFYVQRLI